MLGLPTIGCIAFLLKPSTLFPFSYITINGISFLYFPNVSLNVLPFYFMIAFYEDTLKHKSIIERIKQPWDLILSKICNMPFLTILMTIPFTLHSQSLTLNPPLENIEQVEFHCDRSLNKFKGKSRLVYYIQWVTISLYFSTKTNSEV